MSPTALNDYVTLGRSGLRVSPLCLGTMTFGEELGWGSTEQDSDAILDRFLDRGGNFIDTANIYTFGHSEQIIGDHIGREPSKRDRAVIATKFCGNLFPDDPNGGGAGRKSLLSACHATPASVALAWVRGRPGVSSTIIGARTVDQLERNLATLAVQLTPDQVRRLDALSAPELDFPSALRPITEAFMRGGISLNGEAAQPSVFVPRADSPRF